jgi:Asp-tRNA(Asn)/Glu-tRNA(Gln) amidotransferase A subunit family amidase
VPIALGSQTAGSILRPAAYCGVLGLKPTYGLVSRHGIAPLAWSLDHPGPIARSVEDLALVLQVIAGQDARDPATARAHVADYLGAARTGLASPPTIGIVDDFFEAAQSEVRSAVSTAIESLVNAGAQVRRIRLPVDLPTVAAAQQTIMQVEAAEAHARLHEKHAAHYSPRIRSLIEVGALVPGTLYLRAQRIRHRFRQGMEAIFQDVDCLATPTSSNVAPSRDTTGDRTFQAPWSLIGVPALTLPGGLADGLPVGLQLVAGYWEEVQLLAIAAWAEGLLPGILSPP